MDQIHLVEAEQVVAPRYVLGTLPPNPQLHTSDILVIGSGAAGLSAALHASRSANVLLLTRGALLESNSAWAQGGIAAALDRDDSPMLHIEDTLIAGADLCDIPAVEALAQEAPSLMHEMTALGVPFEREDEDFVLGLEGGHSRRRIVHVGDTTGWALTSTLAARVKESKQITILEEYQAVDLIGGHDRCYGVLALDRSGSWHLLLASATILATGGAGALYGLTSNQPAALGEGIAMAYRAGAEVSDMEFVQFHPTVFRTRAGNGFLISEAARGEGAQLLTPSGQRFMLDYDPRGELAPRDVVARGIFAAMQREESDHVLLDLTHLSAEYLKRRFPTIYARCCAEGIDPSRQPIPVAPAAHYLMGGIRTDLHGATSLAGLYAAGECTCTGVHGANRLASNSLLECLVFGRRAAEAALACRPPMVYPSLAAQPSARLPSLSSPPSDWRTQLASLLREDVGLIRSEKGLRRAWQRLSLFPLQVPNCDPDAFTAANAVLVARLITASALLRRESRGAHFRADFPHAHAHWQVHTVFARTRSPYTVQKMMTRLEFAEQLVPA